MNRRAFHTAFLAITVNVLIVIAPVRAQGTVAWHRATVGVMTADDVSEAAIDNLVARGASSILLRVSDAGEASAVQAARLAESKGLGLILVTGPDSLGVDMASVIGPSDGSTPFALLQSHMDSLPVASNAVENLFAERARSIDRPDIAPLAVPGGTVDARWFLMPGPIVVPDVVPDRTMKLAASFRDAHPAVAGGIHAVVQTEPYAFYRAMRGPDGTVDQVVIVTGASGRVRLNVATWFDNDTVLKDAVTGKIAIVNFGYVTFAADASGLVLIEEYR